MGEDNFCGVKIPFLSVCFSFRDYIARLTNFMLWISLVSVTFLLVRQLGRLVRLWMKGNRIPGPPCPSFLGGTRRSSADADPLEISPIRLLPGSDNDVKRTLNGCVQPVPSPKIVFLRRNNSQN